MFNQQQLMTHCYYITCLYSTLLQDLYLRLYITSLLIVSLYSRLYRIFIQWIFIAVVTIIIILIASNSVKIFYDSIIRWLYFTHRETLGIENSWCAPLCHGGYPVPWRVHCAMEGTLCLGGYIVPWRVHIGCIVLCQVHCAMKTLCHSWVTQRHRGT